MTSFDIDQNMHLLLAMACGVIQPTGEDKMEVTVRRRRGQGPCNFVNINGIFSAIQQHDEWCSRLDEGPMPLAWLISPAKTEIFVLVYLLSGCDFLPATYNMPYNRMLAFTMSEVCQVETFTSPILAMDARRK